MAGKDLEQAEIVGVELVEAELRDDEHPDDARPVPQRHGEQRLLDLGRAFDVLADSAVCGIAREKRLPGRRDVTRDPDSDLRRRAPRGSTPRPSSARHGMRRAGARLRRGERRDSCGSRSAGGARRRSSPRSRTTSSRRVSLLETPCSIFRWAIERTSTRLGIGASGRSLSSSWKTTMRLLPRALAVIIAISAQATSSRGFAA